MSEPATMKRRRDEGTSRPAGPGTGEDLTPVPPPASPEQSGRDFVITLHGKEPCVGLPVQYHDGREVIPGVLQRKSLVNPDLWDVKVSLHGAGTAVTRAAVRHSEKPAPGCWSFLPS